MAVIDVHIKITAVRSIPSQCQVRDVDSQCQVRNVDSQYPRLVLDLHCLLLTTDGYCSLLMMYCGRKLFTDTPLWLADNFGRIMTQFGQSDRNIHPY